MRILQFREDEIKFKPEIVKSVVLGNMGVGKKIAARKCKVKDVDSKTAETFLVRNHLMGYKRATKNISSGIS